MFKYGHATPLLPEVVGTAPAMQDVYRMVRLAAPRSANVLLIGETGTGKEVIARTVHKLSRRADGPYIRVNCGALHESLLESELFGHIKGAFTGAVENKTGRFEAAHGGSIFLDEINSMSPKLQVKLLRVLQEREFERVGESRTIRVDVRVIAATNAALETLVENGEFREDLYYRLNVVPILLPPLRERREDIPILAQHFLKRFLDKNQLTQPVELTAEILSALQRHDWPGNVRELENAIERLVVLSEEGQLAADLLQLNRPRLVPRRNSGQAVPSDRDVPSMIRTLIQLGITTAPPAEGQRLYDYLVGGVERELIEQVMRQCDGVQVNAAKRLGINRNTLHKKWVEYTTPEKETPSEFPAAGGAETGSA
ncbi:MAG: sigma-54 dependent transcriptional regulator [Bacteroidales bacterium]|nr:sigma-54 dependent transcriptional regulator [Bacteroidales bacterium]